MRRDIRFTSESGHSKRQSGCLLWAHKGTHALQQSMPGLGEVLSNFRQQLARTERFRHIVIAACCPGLLFFTTERIGGNRDDRDRSQRGIGFNPACGRVAVHDRQLDIHQDQIGPLLCYGGERLLTVFGFDNLIVSRGQHIADDLAIIRLVFDH
jgi:hypothetical protein